MTDLRTAAQQALDYMKAVGQMDMYPEEWAIVGRLEAALAEPVLQTCNCRWNGEVQVQQCTLHEAHVDAIHEWAERAKTAEKKLAALAEPPVDDPHRDHWVAIAEAAQKIAASTECGLAEAKALCAALDRLTDAALAEPVQGPEPPPEAQTEAEKVAYCAGWWAALEKAWKAEPQEPDSPERRCGGPGCDMRCCQPVQEPQGCAHCNHPLYAAVKCRVCGRAT